MAYSAKNAVGEVVLINIIRALYVAVCFSFFLPMFKGMAMWLEIEESLSAITLTGFDTIFGVGNSFIWGSPFALAVFIFPFLAIMATMIDSLYYRLHIVVLVASIAGAVLSVVYFIAMMISLNADLELFGITIREARTSLSWGCLVLIGIYAANIALSFLYKKVADEK
jgi:hypothetical protein